MKGDKIYNKVAVSMLLLLLTASATIAQNEKPFARCKVNRSTTLWGVPSKITLSVFTPTWFAEGVTFPKMKEQAGVSIQNGRSYTHSEQIKGVRYSVVSQDYLYYLLQEGEHSIEFDKFSVSTPPIGGFKGELKNIIVPTTKVNVSLSKGQSSNQTTAMDITVKQQFIAQDTIRVGDVINQVIDWKAKGVPAAFIILPQQSDSLEYATVYHTKPTYKTAMEFGQMYGSAKQKLTYLFTKAGVFDLPATEMSYWNLKSKRVKKVATESKSVVVLPALNATTNQEDMTILAEKRYNYSALIPIILLVLCLLIAAILIRKRRKLNLNNPIHIRLIIVFSHLLFKKHLHLYDDLYIYARIIGFNNFEEMLKCYPNPTALLFYTLLCEKNFASTQQVNISNPYPIIFYLWKLRAKKRVALG